nr:MAG TPA: hypothetical protein [Caudoviricetes sp.]
MNKIVKSQYVIELLFLLAMQKYNILLNYTRL